MSVASGQLLRALFFVREKIGKVFFNDKIFAVIMQKSYRVQIERRLSSVWTALHPFRTHGFFFKRYRIYSTI